MTNALKPFYGWAVVRFTALVLLVTAGALTLPLLKLAVQP